MNINFQTVHVYDCNTCLLVEIIHTLLNCGNSCLLNWYRCWNCFVCLLQVWKRWDVCTKQASQIILVFQSNVVNSNRSYCKRYDDWTTVWSFSSEFITFVYRLFGVCSMGEISRFISCLVDFNWNLFVPMHLL